MSALAYNFFFTEPYYTLRDPDPKSVLSILFFTIVAIIVSNVAAQARHSSRVRDAAGADDRVALWLQPEARQRRYA